MIKDTHKGYIRYKKIIIGGIYMMKVDLTEVAKEELKKVMETRKEDKCLRIYIAGYG